jgi:L-ascorbate metabolism protein UlaG (beta-lactamase superfamily)
MLDAYIDRVPGADGTGQVADDIDDCDWILIGHSHFDHLWGAERILANTSATLVGSYETVRLLVEAGLPIERMICVAGGERIQAGPEVVVTVVPSLHSCIWTGTHGAKADDICLGDLGVTWQEQSARMKQLSSRWATELDDMAIAHLITAAGAHSDRGDGGALIYLIETPSGSVLFQDTTGHWGPIFETLHPDVAILAAAGRANASGDPVQGSLADFVADEAATLGTKQVVLAHHDNWLPGFAGAPDVEPIRRAFGQRAPDVELIEPGYIAGTILFI